MSYLNFLRDNWSFLLAGVILTFSSSYGQTFFISIFADQIKAAHGLTDGGWGLSYTIATTASAVVMIWAGALTDRFRIRALSVWVMLGLAVACLMMTQAPAVWWLVLTVFLLRFTGQGMLSHLAVVAMARWFVATRGKALSIASIGFSIGTAFLPIIFAALLLTTDWRILWLICAAVLLLTIPVVTRLLRQERTPQSMAEESEALGMDSRHWTRAEVLRHPVFWLLVPALLGPPAWGTALWFQQVHIADVKGWSHVAFVALFPLSTAVTVAATFGCGWAIDRFGSARILPFYMLPFAVAFFVTGAASTIYMAAIGLAVLGIGQGIQSTLASAFWAEFFGTRHLGAIKAAAGAIMVFGSAIGPGISGVIIDLGVNFPTQMIWLTLYFLFAAGLCMVCARIVHPRLTRPL